MKLKKIIKFIHFYGIIICFFQSVYGNSELVDVRYINAPLRSLDISGAEPVFILSGKKLPAFTTVEIEREDLESPIKHLYSNEDKNIKLKPVNGFVKIKKIINAPGWTEEELNEWNAKDNYLAAHLVNYSIPQPQTNQMSNKNQASKKQLDNENLRILLIKLLALSKDLKEQRLQSSNKSCDGGTSEVRQEIKEKSKIPSLAPKSAPKKTQLQAAPENSIRYKKSTWGKHQQWYEAAREAIKKHGDGLLDVNPKDAEYFGWSRYPDKIDFYANLLGALSKYESDFDPMGKYSENFWLKTYHSFSFGEYYDPQWMEFGSLRVINEDFIAPGRGFPTHGHRDMEIITYIIQGSLEHKDSMGNGSVIQENEVQYMSAGTGVRHSEFNPSQKNSTHLMQIWIQPDQLGYEPRYQQILFSENDLKNKFKKIVSSKKEEGVLHIRQDAEIFVSKFQKGQNVECPVNNKRAVWIQNIEGSLSISSTQPDFKETILNKGDALGIISDSQWKLKFSTNSEDARVMLFDLNSYV